MHIDTLFQALESYEKEHPHWQGECLLWITEWCLRQLKAFLEDGGENDISWENPFVEMHFPVQCSWHEENGHSRFSLNSGTITTENTADQESALKTLSEIMVRQIEITTLQDLTNRVAFEKNGDQFFPMLDEDLGNRLQAIGDQAERQRFLDDLFRPCSFGAGRIDIEQVAEEESLPTSVQEEFARDWQHVQPPLVSIPLTVDGVSIILVVILEIQPLVADILEQTAYFPLTFGLAIQSPYENVSLEWVESPQASLHLWSDDDRNQLWDIVFTWLKAQTKHLHSIPVPNLEEAVIAVNTTIRVALDKDDPHHKSKILTAIEGQIADVGHVIAFDATLRPPAIMDTQVLLAMVDEVERSETAHKKGKCLEKLVSSLFSTVDGFAVLAERIKTETEEIDICVENNNESPTFRREETLILVECKNWSKKCGKDEFVTFRQKIENRHGRSSLGFLVSWNGFAETITKEMLRGSRERLLVVPLNATDLKEAAAGKPFFDILKNAWLSALSL